MPVDKLHEFYSQMLPDEPELALAFAVAERQAKSIESLAAAVREHTKGVTFVLASHRDAVRHQADQFREIYDLLCERLV